MSALGQKRTSRHVGGMSALPPTADDWHVYLSMLHSALMLAALMMGHHFSISAFCCAARASGVCLLLGQLSWPRSISRCCTAGSARVSTTAASSVAITSLRVPFGAHKPCQTDA